MSQKKYILDAESAHLKIRRMAFQIAEEQMQDNPSPLLLAGIRSNGVVIALMLQQFLKECYAAPVEVVEVELDKRNPGNITYTGDQNFEGKTIILVDDVANSGKTMLYALKPLLAQHPKSIQTLVLVERSHKLFPIHNSYVGLSLSTTLQEHIFVEVSDGVVTGAYLV
jgi:pyrimidine operon attenuation protein/uracil phosphoribosyltransferase